MSTFTLIDSTSLNDHCITRKHFKSLPKPCQIFNGENSFMLLITIEKERREKGTKTFSRYYLHFRINLIMSHSFVMVIHFAFCSNKESLCLLMRNLARNFISSKKEIEYVLTDSYFSIKDYDIKLTHFKL